MPPRRLHHKSRLGCLSCKTRRVKCDERGPPCGACRARTTDCRYESPRSCSQDSAVCRTATVKDLSSHSGAPAPVLLEWCYSMKAHLLHRWSTDTYKSVSTPLVDDRLVWQITVPEMGIQHDFLLNGLLALSAFDLARSCENDDTRYISAALEYQDLAFRGFRTQLRETISGSREAVLYFSLLLTALTLASSQAVMPRGEIDSKVQRTIVLFELLRGIGAVMRSDQDYYSTHPVFRDAKQIPDLPRIPLAKDTEMALGRLREINEKRMPPFYGTSRKTHANTKLYNGCKQALFWLLECSERCVDANYRGYCLAWIAYAGHDYVAAVQRKDTVALLIMMHWGILTDLLSPDYWWAKNFGKSLIGEISDGILDGADEVTREVVAWVQEQVSEGSDTAKS